MRRRVSAAIVGIGMVAALGAQAETRVTLTGEAGITLPILYDAVAHPKASVILFVGGDGDLAHQAKSFLLRVRGRFVAAGMSVAVPDTPSDHPGGFGPIFRTWTAHVEDIKAVVAFLTAKAPVPVFAVGNSNGTISAASGAARLGPHAIAGIVLTSNVWLGGLGQVPIEKIAVPVLIVHDRDDACPASRFALEGPNLTRFNEAPSLMLIALSGGGIGGPRCGTGSPHDFYGVEDTVMPPIISWIESQACCDERSAVQPAAARRDALDASPIAGSQAPAALKPLISCQR